MRILQITCSYFPDKIGGTEVYVRNLSQELLLRGYEIFISYVGGFCQRNGPKVRIKEYAFDGIPVCVLEKNTFNLKTRQLYFDSEEPIYSLFKDYLKKIKPDIVHFHHFSPTEVISQMKVAKEMGLPIIFTYHTPMMTCSRSDMLYLGQRPCDGNLNHKKCLVCAQTKYGIPLFLACAWANLPQSIAECLGNSLSNVNIKGPLVTWLQFPWLVHKRIEKCQISFTMIDHFVAVCLWVYRLLVENDIPAGKITLCRQGVGQIPTVSKRQSDGALRLGYVGRVHPMKGIDVLIQAFRLLSRDHNIELCIYGIVEQSNVDKKYYKRLRNLSSKDNRIKWRDISKEEDKFEILGQLDALVIPSRCLETGPLVLLEAWAVGTPVIGANLGGIAELISDGIGGLLFKSEDTGDLAKVIMRIYNEPDLLKKLNASVPKVQTMKEVSGGMETLYRYLIKQHG